MEYVNPSRGTIRFDDYELDGRSGELRRSGVLVKLQEQPFQILQLLLERPGQVVTRDELRLKIWPDTFVDFDHGINNAIKRLRAALNDPAERPRYIETVASRGYRFVAGVNAKPRQIESLAVLPLEDLSRDPEQEYFAEGMTEALITALAKIGSLRLLSRTTSMRYKKTDKTLPQIARELNVDGIVEGTTCRFGDRVRISVQLVDARTDTHLWAENYDRDIRDILPLHAEVAQATAREVQAKVTTVERAQLAQVHSVTPEAYEAYLRGRYHWYRRPAELRMAVPCFEQAIAKDPTYAAAYAGLADSLAALTAWGLVPASEGSDNAIRAAQRALELDSGLAEAHSALAMAAVYGYDFLTAEKEFERAVELNPRYATAHHLFGFYLAAIGRYEEGYTELQRALRLDPLSSVINAFVGFVYLYGGRFDRAMEQCRKTLELDPNSGGAQGCLGWAQTCKCLYEPAIASLKKACQLWPGSPPMSWLGEAYAKAGQHDEARRIMEELDRLSKRQHVTPYEFGRIHAALNQTDEALGCLEAAYEQRASWMILVKVDPCFDNLHSDPRFQDLLRRMNFPS
jgi:TolB-like protein/Tfp pilus assembly protein PilF